MPLLSPLSSDHDPEVAELARFFNETLGFCPNSVLTMQRRPAIAKAFIQLNKAVMENKGRVTSDLKGSSATWPASPPVASIARRTPSGPLNVMGLAKISCTIFGNTAPIRRSILPNAPPSISRRPLPLCRTVWTIRFRRTCAGIGMTEKSWKY